MHSLIMILLFVLQFFLRINYWRIKYVLIFITPCKNQEKQKVLQKVKKKLIFNVDPKQTPTLERTTIGYGEAWLD